MKITLVTDQFYENGHGTSISAQRFHDILTANGHDVKVVAIDDGSHTAYALKERNFTKPINRIINSQGFQFAKTNKQILESAIKDSDIVHIYLPFHLGSKTIECCRKLNVPCTAAFHLVPENITSTLYLENQRIINTAIWKRFYSSTYRHVKHIHCPSLMVAKQLANHNYNANLHVISNGFNDAFKMVDDCPKPDEFKDKFIIAFAGRFSREKRYDLIIKAVNESKFRDQIQLIFGGNGPVKKQIMKMAKCLPNYPVFSFFSKEQLAELFNYADLYIHPADIEVEGMSCLEAIACGCVPIVSNSPKSATSQFTISQHSIFEHGDSNSLASQIDWWLSHQNELKLHRKEIAAHAQKYVIEKSLNFYINMFESAIQDWDCTYDGGHNHSLNPNIVNYYK